jgi:hypothetical protein
MAIDTETLSANDRVKLNQFMDGAMRVFQETDDLKLGLKDTAKTIADEFGWKPGVLLKAARVAYKSSIEEDKIAFDTMEEILVVTGRR